MDISTHSSISPVVTAINANNAAKKKDNDSKRRDKFLKQYMEMIKLLVKLEICLITTEGKNQENQSDISKKGADVSHKIFENQIDTLKQKEADFEKQQKLAPFLTALKWIGFSLGIALGAAFGGVGAAVVAGAVGALCVSGALDKVVNAIVPENASPALKAVVKTAIVAGLTLAAGAGAGAIDEALESSATSTTATEAAEEGATQAATNTTKFNNFAAVSVGTQTLATLNPIDDAIYASLKACGVSDEKAKLIAQITSLIINIVISIAAFKAAGNITSNGFISPGLQKLAAGAFLLSNLGEAGCNIAQGVIGLDQAKHQKEFAELEEASILIQGSAQLTNNGKDPELDSQQSRIESFQTMARNWTRGACGVLEAVAQAELQA